MAKRTEEAAKLAGLMARKTGAPMEGTESGDLVAVNNALQRHKMSNDHDSFDHIWSGTNEFLQNLKVAGLMPIGETADIGTALRMFRKLWVSELTTLIFRKGNVLVMDGTFVLTKQSGKFAADVAAGDTQIDFGQALTVGDYLLLRAENKMEYMQVGTLVDGTTYNVTRNLDGSGANDWPRESVYFVRGHEGDGWLELTAVDEQRISNFTQGANWDQWLEDIRLGEIDGWQASPFVGNGFAMGNYAANKYLVYTEYDGLTINGSKIIAGNGNVIIDENGISLLMSNGWADLSRLLKFGDSQMPNRFLIGGAKEQFDGTIALIKAQAPAGKRVDLNFVSISDTLSWIDISANCGDKSCGIAGYANSNAMGPNSILNIKGDEVRVNNCLISPVPGENRVLQAGPDGKADADWLPDLSTLYLPIGGKAADSDYLDGKDSSYFAAANHNHAGDYLPINGKAADAEKLDGLDSTQFERASDWLSWTPTCTGWSSYTARRGRYRVQGKTLFFVCEIRGTSNATSATITLPAGLRSANVISTGVWPFAGIGVDNGAGLANPIRGQVANNSTVIKLYKDFGGANWTASGNKQAIFSGWCEIQ